MKGASTAVAAAVLAASLTGVSSAQVPGVGLPQGPQGQLPPVTAPSLPAPSLPAPAPQVEVPSLPVPRIEVPSLPAPRVELPSLPTPSVTQVRLPVPPSPDRPPLELPQTVTGGSGDVPGAVSTGSPPQTASGPGPSGPAAGAGAPGSSPGTRRTARAAALLRGGRGVLGTSFRTPRRLVRALQGCVEDLPQRQEMLLTLRYGVGGGKPHSASQVISELDLSTGQYVLMRRRALRGLVRAARNGACLGSGAAPPGAAPAGRPGSSRSESSEIGPAVAAAASASSGGWEAPRAALRRRGAGSSGGDAAQLASRSGVDTPLALGAEESGGPPVAALALLAALTLFGTALGGAALKPLLHAVRRRSDPR